MAIRKKKSPDYHVPALEKGLDILEALAFAPVPLSLSDLARSLDRTSSELFRMLSTLEKRGFIEKDPISGKFHLTLRLYELAHTHSPVEKLLAAAAVPMRALADRIRESCHLSSLNHDKLVVLAQAESPEQVRFSVEVGASFSAVNTASGCLLLAYLSRAEFEHFRTVNPDYRALEPGAQKDLQAKLEEIRLKAYVSAENETHIGVRDVAVLVGNPSIGLSAALAVAYLSLRGKSANFHGILAALQGTVQTINRNLGLTS
jgi:DNA-binding IclR family transcriptional regulator